MKRSLCYFGTAFLAGTLAACQAGNLASQPSPSPTQENSMTNSSGSSGQSKPPADKARREDVKPSPWQPPAEVDPVPPPVEGDEPK